MAGAKERSGHLRDPHQARAKKRDAVVAAEEAEVIVVAGAAEQGGSLLRQEAVEGSWAGLPHPPSQRQKDAGGDKTEVGKGLADEGGMVRKGMVLGLE